MSKSDRWWFLRNLHIIIPRKRKDKRRLKTVFHAHCLCNNLKVQRRSWWASQLWEARKSKNDGGKKSTLHPERETFTNSAWREVAIQCLPHINRPVRSRVTLETCGQLGLCLRPSSLATRSPKRLNKLRASHGAGPWWVQGQSIYPKSKPQQEDTETGFWGGPAWLTGSGQVSRMPHGVRKRAARNVPKL